MVTTKEEKRYFVGLDLGPSGEHTALAVLERPAVKVRLPDDALPCYAIRHLRRFPPGTHYPAMVDAVRSLLRMPPLIGSMLVLDQTAVGRAITDLFADGLRNRVTCRFCPVTVNVGHDSLVHHDGLHVPKRELVGTLQVLLQSRRLQVARELTDADVLVRELEAFRLKAPTAGTDTLEMWREGQHDDLVLAVALAAWVGEKALPRIHSPRRLPTRGVPG